MHPSLLLSLWFCGVILLQKLPVPWLALALVAAALIAGARARRDWGRLLRRSRWLLAVLVLTFAAMTPGISTWPGAPVTDEGLLMAADHALRLVAVLFAVAWYVGGRTTEELVGALWGLAAASGRTTPRRAVVRLALTLKAASDLEGRGGRWRDLLAEAADGQSGPGAGADDALRFAAVPFGRREGLIAMAAVIATGILWRLLP